MKSYKKPQTQAVFVFWTPLHFLGPTCHADQNDSCYMLMAIFNVGVVEVHYK